MSAPTLRALGWQVARDVNRTIGGVAAIELMRRSFGRAGWLDESQHGLLVAVSRFTPGTNVFAYCAALGALLRGVPGALVSVAVASLPGSTLVAVLTATVATLDQWRPVRALLAIATLVAAVLVLSSAWALVRPYVRGSRRVWTAATIAVAAALFAAGATPVRVLAVLAAWGALTPPKPPPA